MKPILAVLFAAILLAVLAMPVFADAALPPGEIALHTFRTSIVPWLVIEVIVIAAALLVWLIVKRRRK
ncbi:MAG: hypothetical protein II889_08665 [Clostridia bacterium]|nr:hypothetical protein [Clostridia bacterium]MCR5682006.1 hypothetical protein [Clostridiales bacterium]